MQAPMKIKLNNAKDFQVGEKVKWILRPETMMVSIKPRPNYDFSIKGEMESVNYYGSDTEIIVKAKDDWYNALALGDYDENMRFNISPPRQRRGPLYPRYHPTIFAKSGEAHGRAMVHY